MSMPSSVVGEYRALAAVSQQRVANIGRAANIGYVVFAFGAVWALATTAGLAVSHRPVPTCRHGAPGDMSACSDAVRVASTNPPVGASVSRHELSPSLASTRHGDHTRWLDAWGRNTPVK
jgi:hypothetical protein